MNNIDVIIQGANEHHLEVMKSIRKYGLPTELWDKDDLVELEGDLFGLQAVISDYLKYIHEVIGAITYNENAREIALKYRTKGMHIDESE